MSQNKIILSHLRRNPISAYNAVLMYDIYRLAARIKDLRDDGHTIITEMKTNKNKVNYAEYHLIKEAA
tara:strand:+ start:28215 stop:28418 length:204 start_codon:yes stop_codon:yes gene_type:complete